MRTLSGFLAPLAVAISSVMACRATPPPEPPAEPPTVVADAEDPNAERDAILATSELPPTVPAPLAGDAMGVTIHRLSNGMTVYISTNRQEPRFRAWIAVRAGSRNDPANSTGLAHYLEHMLFKGTDHLGTLNYDAERPHLERIRQLYDDLRASGENPARRAQIEAELDAANLASAEHAIPNEMDRLYATLGIEGVNAFTSDERTVYTSNVPTNRLGAWARVEHERFTTPTYRQFFTEIEAVYEEKNLSLDSPWSRTFDALLLALYPAHPYGTQPTIGTVEHLKTPAYGDMIDYFERWYVPNNMAVVLAGDIDPNTALPVLEETLGAMSPRPLRPPDAASVRPLEGRVHREVTVEDSQGVMVAWHTVSATHADEPALIVMDWLMDNATSGLLNTELELSQKVPSVGSWASFFNEAGYWGVRATARDEQPLPEVEAMLLEVVGMLKRGEFTQEDIDAIVVNQDIADKRRLESNSGRVSKMSNAFIQRRAWADELARDKALRAVTKDDVLRVANTYLGDNRVVLYSKKGTQEVPSIEKPTISPIKVDASRESPFARSIRDLPADELEPRWLVEGRDYVHGTLPAGPMIAAVNKRNDLFSVDYTFDRGSRREPMLCHALTLLEQSGYGDQSVAALKKQLFSLGTDITFGCDADSSAIYVSGIDKYMERSLEILRDWMADPRIDPYTLTKLNTNKIARRRNNLDNSDFLGWALASYARYGERSALLHVPSNRKIQSTKSRALAALIRSFPSYGHRTLYFGPRPAKDVGSVIKLGDKYRPVKPPEARRFRTATKPTIYFLHRENAKASVTVTLPIGKRPASERPLALALAEYLDGDMGSLIFQEIREARGLAYSSWGDVDFGDRPDDEWALMGGVGTQADKTPEALTTLLELVRARPVEPGRFEVAKTSIDQGFRASRVDPRWVVDWVESWDELGETADPRPKRRADIAALTAQQLDDFAAQFKDEGVHVIISIVGNREAVDLAALSKIGTVTELKADALVSYGRFPRAPRKKTQPAKKPTR